MITLISSGAFSPMAIASIRIMSLVWVTDFEAAHYWDSFVTNQV